MKKILLFLVFLPVFVFSQSPGNVSAGLSLWLKADAGVEKSTGLAAVDNDVVLNWLDQSGNSNDVTQATASKKPIFESDASNKINFYPVVKFDGSNDELIDGTGILGAAAYTDVNAYIISKTNASANDVTFSEQTLSGEHLAGYLTWSGTTYWDAGNYTAATNRISAGWGGTANTPYLWSLLFSTTSGQTYAGKKQLIQRNALTTTSDNTGTSFSGNNNAFHLGNFWNGTTTYCWQGEIAECIIYTGAITAAEHNKSNRCTTQ